MKLLLAVALALARSTVVHADVLLIDPTIDVSAQYMTTPASTFGAHAAVVGTGVHIVDRNGIYTAIISALAGSRCSYNCNDTTSWTSVKDYGAFLVLTPQTYTATQETAAAREARRQAGEAIGFGSSTYTELAVWLPAGTASNATGGMFGMGGAAYGNGKIALDLGIRWSYQRTDVCGPADAPTRCAQRFLGVPIRLIMKFGPIGAEIEGDYNWRSDGSSLRAGASFDLGDRLFVHGGAFAKVDDLGAIGYFVDVGGRL